MDRQVQELHQTSLCACPRFPAPAAIREAWVAAALTTVLQRQVMDPEEGGPATSMLTLMQTGADSRVLQLALLSEALAEAVEEEASMTGGSIQAVEQVAVRS